MIEDSKNKIDQEHAEVIAWAETCIPESRLVWELNPGGNHGNTHVQVYRKIMFKDENDALAFRMRWM
ncbi:MAG: hypothetical protein EOP83_11770 [Verrucomicrobiaceae bacterium]|nr:MAG: hypothetical protein EOP83_11770 [Verrucomicrobiaceae bacterium]